MHSYVNRYTSFPIAIIREKKAGCKFATWFVEIELGNYLFFKFAPTKGFFNEMIAACQDALRQIKEQDEQRGKTT